MNEPRRTDPSAPTAIQRHAAKIQQMHHVMVRAMIHFSVACLLGISMCACTSTTVLKELDLKSGGGLFARMWRSSAGDEAGKPSCPSIVRLANGDLLLMFTHESAASDSGALGVVRSNDDGKTWSAPQTVYESTRSVPKAMGTLIRLQLGRLLAPFVDGDELRILVSNDHGSTWTPSGAINTGPLLGASPYGQMVENSGELLMPVFGTIRVTDGEAACSGLLRSQDGGKTWKRFTVIACDHRRGKIAYGPTTVHVEPDGRMLALINTDGRWLSRSISTDGGKSWSKPQLKLRAQNASLTAVGCVVASVIQDSHLPGMIRVQFSHNLFDSWSCDRMLDQELKGEHTAIVALDDQRILIVHDRGDFAPEGRGTPASKGIEVAMMQRNPAAPDSSHEVIPPDQRDRWEMTTESFSLPMPTGMGVSTIAPDGRLLIYTGGKIYASTNGGRTFEPVAKAPESAQNAGIFGVLRSGRWLVATPDWRPMEENPDMDWTGKVDSYTGVDGYHYERLYGVKGVNKLWIYWSDDQGKTWSGGDQAIPDPFIWLVPEGRFIDLDDGTIVMTTYGCLSHEDTSGRLDCAAILRSTDGGETWGDFTSVAYDDQHHEIAYNEMDIQPMLDGTWVAVIRTEWRSHSGGEAASSSVCFSRDKGRTWTNPEYAFIGAVPSLLLLPDGSLLWVGSGNRIRISYDGGHTWGLELPAHALGYPGGELIGNDELFICGRWGGGGPSVGSTGCRYRRVPAESWRR